MNWSLLNPWAVAIGMGAFFLPVAIHFLTRPRPIRVSYPTVRFVEEVLQQRRARDRLRDALILALRTLAVVLLAMALARPLGSAPSRVASSDNAETARIVLVDVSQSMAAQDGGVELLERGRASAARHLARQGNMKANLILAGAIPRAVFPGASPNLAALRDELRQTEARPERLAAQAALNLAAEMLAEHLEGDARLELIVISDFQRSAWSQADFSPLPERTHVVLETATGDAPLANLAVLDVRASERWQSNRPGQLEVEIGNFSVATREIEVEVRLGDAVHRLSGTCAPGTTTLTAEVSAGETGWLTGEARLLDANDALAGDNVRPVAIEVRAAPTFLLVTREPEGDPLASTYYLERALAPLPSATSERVRRLLSREIAQDALAEADCVVLDHPGQLPQEEIERLAALVRRGRGLLYVVAEPSDAVNLARLKTAAGADLELPVVFAAASPRQPRRDLSLASVSQDRVPFRAFGDELTAALRPLRFSGGLSTRENKAGLSDDVLAHFSDRSVALLMTSCGAGRVVVLNADLARSNLPVEPIFVPLVNELMSELVERHNTTSTVPCGEPAAVYLPPQITKADELVVHLAAQALEPRQAGGLIEEPLGVLWRVEGLQTPSVYTVQQGTKTVFALAAAIPRDESDLERLAPQVVQGRLASDRLVEIRAAGTASAETDRSWTYFAVACVLCLLGELAALRWLRT